MVVLVSLVVSAIVVVNTAIVMGVGSLLKMGTCTAHSHYHLQTVRPHTCLSNATAPSYIDGLSTSPHRGVMISFSAQSLPFIEVVRRYGFLALGRALAVMLYYVGALNNLYPAPLRPSFLIHVMAKCAFALPIDFWGNVYLAHHCSERETDKERFGEVGSRTVAKHVKRWFWSEETVRSMAGMWGMAAFLGMQARMQGWPLLLGRVPAAEEAAVWIVTGMVITWWLTTVVKVKERQGGGGSRGRNITARGRGGVEKPEPEGGEVSKVPTSSGKRRGKGGHKAGKKKINKNSTVF